MNTTYHHISFTVAGHGVFPLDMLRWDECFPVSPTDVHNLYDPLAHLAPTHGLPASKKQREVTLSHMSRNKLWQPTEARWASFGWIVTEVSS